MNLDGIKCVWLSLMLSVFAPVLPAEEPAKLPILYPFVRDGKWGYIDGTGAWVIEPRFQHCRQLFEGDRVSVSEGERWGYIDRSGQWIVKSQFTSPILCFNQPFEVVSLGKKQGILEHSGTVLLPPKYDAVELLGDRAWVRDGEKLGLFGFNGRWILKPSIKWPQGREMPIPTEDGVSWFKRGNKWGLFSRDGKVLFEPQFAEHVMGRKESEDWNHPEGLDFKNGRAWVTVGKEYRLITAEGKVLVRQPFQGVRPWTEDFYIFISNDGKQGLISKDGEIVLAARFTKISQPSEGLAVVEEQKNRKNPNGETDTWWIYGYIDEHGKVVVEPGIYAGPGVSGGGQVQLAPFSDGLAPVWNNSPEGTRTSTSDRCAGYIDHTGTLVIPEQFSRTEPFSDGLGAVSEKIKGHTSGYYYDYEWGYVDKTGTLVIPPQFGWTTPFCRDRAWVLKAGCNPQDHYWAMIDRTGKVLTDYAYVPPEKKHTISEYDWDASPPRKYSEAEVLQKARWRGNLAVICKGDFLNGLADTNGKVLVEPIFNRINEFHDGVAVAVDSRGRDEKGNVTFAAALITDDGRILAYDTYTTISDFHGGVGWATHRWTDHRGPYQREGWGLIDTNAHEISEFKYFSPGWVWSSEEKYTDNRCPTFYGDLAPVALAEGYQPYGEQVWLQNSWGYINRAGKIVVWQDKAAGK